MQMIIILDCGRTQRYLRMYSNVSPALVDVATNLPDGNLTYRVYTFKVLSMIIVVNWTAFYSSARRSVCNKPFSLFRLWRSAGLMTTAPTAVKSLVLPSTRKDSLFIC